MESSVTFDDQQRFWVDVTRSKSKQFELTLLQNSFEAEQDILILITFLRAEKQLSEISSQ